MAYVHRDPNRRNEYRLLAAAEDANQIIQAARAEARAIKQNAERHARRTERLAYELGRTRARVEIDALIVQAERPQRAHINLTRLDELAAGQP